MFEVILSIIYSCKREHLSGVVIWTQQASCLKPQTFRTHFRSLDEKKKSQKGNKALPERNEWTNCGVALFYLYIVLTHRLRGEGEAGLGLSLWPAEAWLPATRLQAVKTASLFVLQKVQLLRPLQNQLALTFTSAFWHLPQTWRAQRAVCTTWPAIVGYTLFCVTLWF